MTSPNILTSYDIYMIRYLCLSIKGKLGVVFYHFKMLRMATRAIKMPHSQICPVQIPYLQFVLNQSEITNS
jgi:hypothetical protein